MINANLIYFSSGDFAIEFVGVMASGGSVSICTITGIVDGTDEYECTYNIPQTAGWEDKLKNGYGLAARSISYGGKSYTINPDSEVGGYYGGPPALETGDFIVYQVFSLFAKFFPKLIDIRN